MKYGWAKTLPTENPATGETLTEVASCNADDVNVAVANTKAVYEDGVWSKLSPSERKSAVLKLTDLVEEHAVDLAGLETLESGKPIHEYIKTDLPETIRCIR